MLLGHEIVNKFPEKFLSLETLRKTACSQELQNVPNDFLFL